MGLPRIDRAGPPAPRDPVQLLIDTVLKHGDVGGILPEVLRYVGEAFGADSAVLFLTEDDGRHLRVVAAHGPFADDLPSGEQFPASGTATSVREGENANLEDLIGVDRAKLASRRLRSTLGAAMFVDSTLLGSIHLGWSRARQVASDFPRLRGFADRIALAIDHARLYRAEREARNDASRAERRFVDLVHNLDAVVWEAELPEWRYTFVSRRAEKILGYPVAEWLATPDFWLRIVHPEDRPAVEAHRRELLQRGRGGAMEYRVYAGNGRVLWVRVLCEVVRDLAGVPRQTRGLMLDVTEYRHAQRDALLLAAIVKSTDDAVFGKDLQGTVLTWNAGAEKMYGYTADEVIGENVSIFVPARLRNELAEIMAKLRAGEGISHLETQRLRKDGETIDVALTISPIRDPKTNAVVGASTIARDITGMKAAERTLHNTEKLAATGRLAASIAHEINNPMASVTNLLYLLEHHGTLDATATGYVKLAQEELQRITHIVRQMLGFYRESDSPVAVDLEEIIDNVLLLYSRRLQNMRITVQRSVRSHPPVQGYPGEIRQVLSNLLVNAIEAVGEKGRLRVDVRPGRDWSNPRVRGVRVLVADNGPGIPPAVRKRMFEPFFTTKGERGTGLGLWVSEGIVRKHGGSMRVRSASGESRHGTCFSLFFPLQGAARKPAKSA